MNSDIKEICGRLLDGPAPPLRSAAEMVDLGRRARRRRHGRLAAAGAGLAVVAVAVAATAVPLVDGSGTPEESDFGAAVASAAPPSPSAAPREPSPQPSLDLGREVRRVKVSQAISEMSKAAPVPQLTIPDGQFLYVRTDGREPPDGRVHEMWLDPQGMIPLRIDIDGADTSTGPKSNIEADIATARQVFAQEGPNLRMPTPRFLASLPTDPAVLLNMVTALNEGTKLGGAHYAFKEIGELFWEYGALLTPAVRVAFYRALGRINGVTGTELRVDGRRLYALREPDKGLGFAEELLLDPSTGQAAGRRSLDTGGQVTPTDLELWRYAVVGAVGQRG
jgi:hypothetical protein